MIYLLKSILLILFYSKQYQFTYDLKAKFTSNVFSHYIYSPYSFHLNNSSHELIRNVGNEVSLVATGIIHQLIIIGTELLIIGSIIIFLIIQSPKIILTLLLFFLIIGILYYLSTSKKIRDLGHLRQTVTTDIVKKTMNSLYGIKDIKILGKEDYFSKLYKNSAYELSRLSRSISILSQIPKIVIEMALILIVGIIALSLSGNISEIIKVVGLLIFAGLRLMPSISKILFSIQQLKYNKPAMNVVYDILKISDEKIVDTKNDNNISTINFDKNIEFQNIKFRYKDGREIFNNINVIFNKGDKIGIFGGSGNGKSTFIDLLSSLIEPTDGTILVDGQKLNESIK